MLANEIKVMDTPYCAPSQEICFRKEEDVLTTFHFHKWEHSNAFKVCSDISTTRTISKCHVTPNEIGDTKGLHWSQKVVTLATLSPLAAPEVITRQYAIFVATAGTESYDNDNPRSTKDGKVGIMTDIFLFSVV